MHLLVTIPQPNSSNGNHSFAPLIREAFSPGRTGGHGPFYFVRTWDGKAGAEVLQISLDNVSDPAATRDDLQELARKHGCAAQVEETPTAAVPSPLWNAGFAGSGFSDSSKRLFRQAAPILVAFLDRAAEERDPLRSALGAIRLMVVHSRATLLRSPQRDLKGYDFPGLLSLRLLSYRSHFEAVYPRSKDPESFEAACARFYEQVGPATREFISECGDPNTGTPADRVLGPWTELIAASSASLADDFLAGTVVDAGKTLDDLVRERGGPVEPTRFHTPPSPELNRLMHRDADFLAFRLQTSLLYSSLYSLGFSLAERYVFCYVVARASEEVAGRSTEELRDDLDHLARSMAAVSSPATG
ncbi:hypothetical protein LKL35_23490 [Streptomyces sp. ET3-23]|uniref:hypothetical protein n=1 Tax=Streptomyces sp. ET3-23 TaxID=2885643 RepID=UPI001D0FCD5F|nr:hypothetical protein [Streptomyces sp. ET3-23]MCC2278363.1 hypothetical protein [Streptomyces sp. ET3-23]